MHRLQPGGAVRPGSRQHDARRTRSILLRQGGQQGVEGQPRAARRPLVRLRRREAERAAVDRQVGAGRDDIQVLALDKQAVRGLHHRHGGVLGQQFDKQAFVVGFEVLDQDEGHARGSRQGIEQVRAGFQSTGGGAQCNHGKAGTTSRRIARCPRAVGRS